MHEIGCSLLSLRDTEGVRSRMQIRESCQIRLVSELFASIKSAVKTGVQSCLLMLKEGMS